MADYYTLLARAVAALPASTPETRRSIYERARNALLGQLRISDPPAAEEDIQRESSALDAAIARVEADYTAMTPAAPAPAAMAAPVLRPAPAPPAATPAIARPQMRPPAPPASSNTALPSAAEPPDDSKNAAGKPARPKAPVSPKPTSGGKIPQGRWLLLGGAGAAVIACVAAAAILLPNPPFDGTKPRLQEPVTVRPADPKPNKIGDRIGGTPPDAAQPPVTPAPVPLNSPAPVAAADNKPAIPVSQRAAIVLQVTPEDKQTTKTFVGTAVWRTDSVNGGPGQPVQSVVRADVDIPEAKVTATILFQNNKDLAFPASHTIKVRFNLAPGALMVAVKAIDVPEMREENAPNGARLLGLAATIADNNFLAALAQGETVVPRNVELIRTRPWLDIPFQLANGLYGKLVIEKGQPGERIVNDALAAWAN